MIFAHAAELALEIIGEILPLLSLLLFIVDPAADLAYVLHGDHPK